jgi:hypothetical protein
MLSKLQGHSAAVRIRPNEKSNNLIRNQTPEIQLVAQCLNQLLTTCLAGLWLLQKKKNISQWEPTHKIVTAKK